MSIAELKQTKHTLWKLFEREWKAERFESARKYAKAHDEISLEVKQRTDHVRAA